MNDDEDEFSSMIFWLVVMSILAAIVIALLVMKLV